MRRFPGRPQIVELHLDTFHIEPDRAAAGEVQHDGARRRIRRFEADRQERQDAVRGIWPDPQGLDRLYPGELKPAAPPLVRTAAARMDRLPDEAVGDEHEL